MNGLYVNHLILGLYWDFFSVLKMLKDKLRPLVFRGILLILVLFLLECIGYFGLWINSRSVDWLANKNYFNLRAMLAGDDNPGLFPRFLTLPYLGYIPFPGYLKDGVIQHNEDGYRGKRVPMLKGDKLRILFIGGSTTYGLGVKFPNESFPALLEMKMNSYLNKNPDLKAKFSGVEVINSGIFASTSAEELQQYLFKYRYYKPDLVVVHSGINDAELTASLAQDFQLDYTHYRRINFHLEPLPQPMRFLMNSNLISFFVIRLIYDKFSAPGNEYKHQYHQRFCKWTQMDINSIVKSKNLEFYPFYKNTNTLFSEIVSDSAQLVVIPTIINVNDSKVRNSLDYINLNAMNQKISRSLCEKYGGTLIPFSLEAIKSKSSWMDDCHLDAKGEKEKADFLFPYFKNLMVNNTEKKD